MGNKTSKVSNAASSVSRHIDISKPHSHSKIPIDNTKQSENDSINQKKDSFGHGLDVDPEKEREIDRILGEKNPNLVGWMEQISVQKTDLPVGTTAPVTPPGAVQTPPPGYKPEDDNPFTPPFDEHEYPTWTPDNTPMLTDQQQSQLSPLDLENQSLSRAPKFSPLEAARTKFNLSQMENPDFDRLPRPTAHPKWEPPTTPDVHVTTGAVTPPPPSRSARDAQNVEIYGSSDIKPNPPKSAFASVQSVDLLSAGEGDIEKSSGSDFTHPPPIVKVQLGPKQEPEPELEPPAEEPPRQQPGSDLSNLLHRVNASRSSFQKKRQNHIRPSTVSDTVPKGLSTNVAYNIYDVPVGIDRRQLQSLYFPDPLKDVNVPAITITDDQKDLLKTHFSLLPQESSYKELPYHIDDLFFSTNIRSASSKGRTKIGSTGSTYLRADLPESHFKNPSPDADTGQVWYVTRHDKLKEDIPFQRIAFPENQPRSIVNTPRGPKYDPEKHGSPEDFWDK